MPAVKLPLASLETIEFGVLELVAVVALLLTFPAVVIVESFVSEIDPASFASVTDEFAKSPVAIEPSKILEELTASAAILSAVTAPSAILVELLHHQLNLSINQSHQL